MGVRPLGRPAEAARRALLALGFVTLAASASAWTGGLAEASNLRIAAWNLEHLNDARGEGCVERSEQDFNAIARQVEALGADVVAFQEVENEAAARRVFDPARWNIAMSSRPDTGEGPVCYNRPEGRLQHQATGIAIRRTVAYRRGTDLSSLAGANPFLRWGTHIVVGRGDGRIHVLSVHLKSGCWGARQDAQGREACTVLRRQMHALRAWIDERERKGERFVIAGDFNRRLAIPDDWAWRVLSPGDRPLELATEGRRSHCDARFPNFIDHLVLGGPDAPGARPGSFREEARDGPHPDHCAISVALADGPAGSAGTRVALRAWTSAFARMSTDQLVGSIERRLAEERGSYATAGGAAAFARHGASDLLSRASFRVSPVDGASPWSVWGSGTAGSISAREHDLEARVRTATLGADIERAKVILGVALAHSLGRGSTLPTGPIDAEVSSIAPYLGLVPREGVRLWAVAGKGEGSLRFEPAEGRPVRTDLETTLGALGLRAELGEVREVRWSANASGAITALETGALAELAPIDLRVGRLRASVEGSRRLELGSGAALSPILELGLRHDVGDDGAADALELGAGLQYERADARLGVDGHAKGYLSREDGNGWEVAGQLVMRADARGRGFSLTLQPAFRAGGGDGGSMPFGEWPSNVDARSAGEVAGEVGYGIAMGGGRGLVRPFAGVEWAGEEAGSVRLGARWRWGEALRLRLEAEHAEAGGENDTFALTARAALRW